MSARHTPGPWAYDGRNIAAGERLIARMEPCDSALHKMRGTLSPDEDARLIASAPELLTALEACDLAFAGWQVGQVPGRPEDILRLIEQTRAALAKARGEP